jgi:ParB-like nuclease family protein
MAKHVPIGAIRTDRKLEPDDDISESTLAWEIRKSGGLEVPILVDGNYNLIDGLRRLEALRALGHTKVEVTATSMFPVACEHIKRAREHGVGAVPLSPRRIWEIHQALKPVLTATKSHFMTGRRKGTGAKGSAGGRPLLAMALGLGSESVLQAVTQVYRTAANEGNSEKGKRAKEAIRMLEAGETTVYGAVAFMTSNQGLKGNLRKYHEQKDVLDNAIASMRGIIRGLQDLGPLDPRFPLQEAQTKLKDLARIRGQFYRFIRTYDEEIKKHEE